MALRESWMDILGYIRIAIIRPSHPHSTRTDRAREPPRAPGGITPAQGSRPSSIRVTRSANTTPSMASRSTQRTPTLPWSDQEFAAAPSAASDRAHVRSGSGEWPTRATRPRAHPRLPRS